MIRLWLVAGKWHQLGDKFMFPRFVIAENYAEAVREYGLTVPKPDEYWGVRVNDSTPRTLCVDDEAVRFGMNVEEETKEQTK